MQRQEKPTLHVVGPPAFNLRMPPGLRKKVEGAAVSNRRSMNAEILSRLEHSFDGYRT